MFIPKGINTLKDRFGDAYYGEKFKDRYSLLYVKQGNTFASV